MAKNIDWSRLGFDFFPTKGHAEAFYATGEWGAVQTNDDPYVRVHVAATSINYGQAVFEGLKAFRSKDGQIRVFRPDQNCHRMARSAERLSMPPVPMHIFIDAINLAVQYNSEFVPPFETGGALYIRPVLFASGPQISLKPAREYTFIVFVVPVGGGYYGAKAVSAVIVDDFDRSAPLGVGAFKTAGNYAPAMLPNSIAYSQGHPITLFLDAKEHKYIEEFNSSNFAAVTKDGVYVTPESSSILPSITNASLIHLAKHLGIPVQVRPVDYEAEVGSFVEVGAVGTAVIITPIRRIVRGDRVATIGESETMGPVLKRLYDEIRKIQTGEGKDFFGWMHLVPV